MNVQRYINESNNHIYLSTILKEKIMLLLFLVIYKSKKNYFTDYSRMQIFTMKKKLKKNMTFKKKMTISVINVNKSINKQFNKNDCTITGNHILINKIKNDYIKKYGTIVVSITFCAPFHNRKKKPQPYKTEVATKNFSSI